MGEGRLVIALILRDLGNRAQGLEVLRVETKHLIHEGHCGVGIGQLT